MHWVVLCMAVVICCYYLWAVRASASRFEWGRDLGGFYDYLGRSFVSGQLSMPFRPAPELLALPNPWDPGLVSPYKVSDLVLYNGRYYLYHGAAPAVLLFTPWRLITGHDLPENFAVFLFAFGGVLLSSATLLRVLTLTGSRPGPGLVAVLLLALGICQGVPFLTGRVFVYEVAIAGGYFCLSAALLFLAYALPVASRWRLAAAGLMFGLAVGCRPDLIFPAGIATAGLAVYLVKSRAPRRIVSFLLPLCTVGAGIATYNYVRFGNPFEFGVKYLLTDGPNQNRIQLSASFLLPGLYYFLWCAPDFSSVFPWVRLAFRHPFGLVSHSFPPGYFIEPTTGVLYLAPFVIVALFVPRRAVPTRSKPADFQAARAVLWIALGSGLAVLLGIAWTGFTTERYVVDFLPSLVLVAVVNFAVLIDRKEGWQRGLLAATLIVLVGFGAVVNLVFGISGPHYEMLQYQPKRYLRLAGWFSAAPRLRPLLNPNINVTFTAEFTPHEDGFREPLLTLGGIDHHFIYVEHTAGALRIVSRSGNSNLAAELELVGAPRVRVAVLYRADTGKLTTFVNGHETLSQAIPLLLTAPAEVSIGENDIDPAVTSKRFTGRIYDIEKNIEPAR